MEFFRGCTALITGASSGLGAEFARQLAPRARALVLVARRLDRLEAMKSELTREHPQLAVFTFQLDLADEMAIENFVRWLEVKFESQNLRVDLLINNAGLGDHGTFESADWQRVKQILDVNIAALTKLTHRLLPMLRRAAFTNSKRKKLRAAILNVSSTASFVPVPHMAVYAATKAYVTSFSEALRAELRGSGVSVTALCPGPVDTEFGTAAERGHERNKTPMSAPELLKITPERAVRLALQAVARDRARIVPGFAIWFLMLFACATPMFLLRISLNIGEARMKLRSRQR